MCGCTASPRRSRTLLELQPDVSTDSAPRALTNSASVSFCALPAASGRQPGVQRRQRRPAHWHDTALAALAQHYAAASVAVNPATRLALPRTSSPIQPAAQPATVQQLDDAAVTQFHACRSSGCGRFLCLPGRSRCSWLYPLHPPALGTSWCTRRPQSLAGLLLTTPERPSCVNPR
jgi:hypothetical protein